MKADLESPEAARARLSREELTDVERARTWARIQDRTRGARRLHPLVKAALAFGTIGVLGTGTLLLQSVSERKTLVWHGEVPKCELREGSAHFALDPTCTPASVAVRGDDWELSPGSTVFKTADGARVVKGTVTFHVRHRTAAPFIVRVSHGTVGVIGTVFRIVQDDASGSVTVSEGAIEFVWDDGAFERVSAGQTLHFPRRPPSAAVGAPGADAGGQRAPSEKAGPARNRKAGADAAAPKPPADLESVMDRLLQLKSQRRFVEAAALLRQTLARGGLGPVQRERFSYELGLVLEASGQRPCAHWKNHAAVFGSGRFEGAIQRRLEACRE